MQRGPADRSAAPPRRSRRPRIDSRGAGGDHAPMSREDEVLVIGAGPAGLATSACLRRAGVAHTVVEREAGFVSCPMSNLVLAGNTTMKEISRDYSGLTARGVNVV